MGLVPLNAKVEYLVCVMYGSEARLILWSSKRGRFNLIRFSSLYGFDHDTVIAETSSRTGRDRSRRGFYVSALDGSQRQVYTTLKPIRRFVVA